MKKKLFRRRFRIVSTFVLTLQILLAGFLSIIKEVRTLITYAALGNQVFLTSTEYEANDSNIVYATIRFEANAGDKITVHYRTFNGTAIDGYDYQGASNSITVTMPQSEVTEYKIAIKCLNDTTNRQYFHVMSGSNNYGRYFNLELTSVENAVFREEKLRHAKCYLGYAHKVSATVGLRDSVISGEIAYLNEYANMQMEYEGGVSDLDGGSNRKTWSHGMSFNNETTRSWIPTFIDSGYAEAYASFVVQTIDDGFWDDGGRESVLAGNKEFIENWKVSKDVPGLFVYFKVNPPGTRLDGRAMKYISNWINPYKKDKKLVDADIKFVAPNHKPISWIVSKDTWFSSKNSVYESEFWKIDPYKGVLDAGIMSHNHNWESDMMFKKIWGMMTLYDDKNPTLIKDYAEYNSENGSIRIYLRFSEPVYASQTGSALTVNFNNSSRNIYAEYVEGNYSDTLVYEVSSTNVPLTKIESITYELPNNDIGDMAYKLDSYKIVHNNRVQNTDQKRHPELANGVIDLSKPSLAADPASSLAPHNYYNILLDTNGGSTSTFREGTVYYTLDTNETIENPLDPNSYAVKHVLTSDEQGSFSITLSKNASINYPSGKYYLHALAVSNFGFTSVETFGPYTLDGDAPVVTQLPLEDNKLMTKIFAFEVEKKSIGTSIKDISLVAKFKEDGKEKTLKRALVKDEQILPQVASILSKTEEDNKTIYRYKSNIDASIEGEIALDVFIKELLGTKMRFVTEIGFEAVDSAGNKGQSEFSKVVYDLRELFDNDINYPESYIEDHTIDVGQKVFNIHGATPTDGITFSIKEGDTDIKHLIDEGAKYGVIINEGEEIFAEEGTPYTVKLSNLKPGHYDLVGHLSGESGGAEVDLVSNVTSIYLTDDFKDDTANKVKSSGNLVFTNHVYQIEDARFYYLQGESAIGSHLYGATPTEQAGKYEGGSSSPTFSNHNEAKKYMKFMEYQDLDLISISDSIASFLNNGSSLTVYAKAAGETTYAQAGQLWIRYKKKTFSVDNVGTNGWAYYYYGSGNVENGIDVNSLSENLRSSIDTVVNGIVSRGSEKYLVTEDDLDHKSYAPYLAQSQIHFNEETAANTKTGIPYVSYPIYPGDKNIYKNTVLVDEVEYPLATNMALSVSKSTTLYYQYIGASSWSRIECEDGTVLKEVLKDNISGVYAIREYDEKGVSQFNVYLDKDLPEVHATVTNASGSSEIILDGTVNEITCKSLAINDIVNEADDLAYVAIYSYPSKSLIKVLYPKDIQGYVLSGANYYVQVGDRSGNSVTYRVLTSDSPIDMSVVENEDKTAVIVRVNNRDENEIYEFAVYLNEVLIDSTFDTYKIYRDPGVYRVEITDIYNNKDYVTLTHETPSPRLTWYYLNDNGGYSQYDPLNPVRLILEDSATSPRTTYVYSSTLVKIQMSSAYDNQDIEFEVKGLEGGQYAYNSTSGVLTINSLASWTLRVWYSNSPESDRSYVFILDNDAPEIGGSLIGVTYHPLVEYEGDEVIGTASFDVLKPGYQDGDPISLDYLDSVNDGNANVEFTSGGVVSGNRIVVLVTDPSGIRSVNVTRNGQPVQAELNSDNQLILTNYGLYVITVTDNLGNVSTFSFTNVEKGIANATVDGEAVNENEPTCGHDSLNITTFYEGTNTILVKDGENSYTYVFNYDGEKVTYGQYYVTTEQYVDKDDEIKTQQVAEFIENLDFIIYSKGDNAKLNTWFVAVENEDFIIYALIDDNLNVHYKVACVDEEIAVESSFSVGKTHLPAHFEAELSKEVPEVTLLTDGEEVEIIEGLDYIYITNELTIDETSVSSNIEKIEFAFNSDVPSFEEYETIYENGAWTTEFVEDEFGFYQIIVTNKYNNQTIYTINKIESFSSIVTIYTLDGSEVKFYESRDICSNSAIELSVVSDTVHFEVNGSPTSGISEGGITTLYLDRAGVYEVKVIGANGITEDFNFEIKNDVEFIYDESWMTGYNEQALLRDQGYTNQALTVHVGEDVVFIDVVLNDEEHIVLYDNITEDKKPNEDELVGVIGKYGVGKYVVGFRNKYGDLVKKTIYFNNVPSLELNRIILSDPNTYQSYDLEFAIEKGYYSNYLLGFSTTSETYKFTINGEEYRLDTMKTLEFSNPNGKGSFTYHITFLDEYGNYIEFDAILQREDVVFDSSSMNIINNNGVYYTKDDICITFADGLKATLTVDGGETVDYYSGQMRYQDGEYVFVVRDIAGNNVRFVINHKSVNHYTLTNSANGQVVIDGGVVNDGSIVFISEDGCKILYVVRNGELVSDFNSTTFSQTGHYEIIITDNIGNMSYEEFYVINNSLAEFTYTAPLDYEVTEVWRVKPDGSKEQINFKGTTLTLNQDGDYVVVVTSPKTTNSFNFTITIDNTKPSATLVGAVDGGVTAEDVSLSNLKIGDVVKVYRDGELISTTVIGVSEGSPEITTGGKYRVTVTNVQGLTVEYNFTRKAIANVAGSIFIIVSSTLLIVGIGIGLIYHTKLKTDD